MMNSLDVSEDGPSFRHRKPLLNKIVTCVTLGMLLLIVILLGVIAVKLPSASSDANIVATTTTTVPQQTTTATTTTVSATTLASTTAAPTTAPRQHEICSPLRGLGAVQKEAHKPLLLRHATVIVGDRAGSVLADRDLLLQNGLVAAIDLSGRINAPSDAIAIDCRGRFVTPGIVDMHSHAGVGSYPSTFGTEDVNEMTNPTTPQVRAIDGFNPHDPALDDIVAGGVTTIQVIPGSGNAMGGEGAVFKVWPRRSGRAVIPRMRVVDNRVHLKMACGENVKRVYGRRGAMPMSRLGSAWIMRAKFEAAAKLRAQQDRWCAGLETPATPAPTDLSLQNIVRLLRGEAILNVHCYKTEDLEMIMRLSDEFGFKIDSVHHAHEAFQIADELARRNISTALFSDNYAYKMEAIEGSIRAPAILDDAGVPVTFVSDHPVLDASYLMIEAQRAAHNGMKNSSALASVFSVPAAAIGLAGRVGSLQVGVDADVVIWDRHPLSVGARPDWVSIEGVVVFEQATPELQPNVPPPAARWNATTFDCASVTSSGALAIRGARLFKLEGAQDSASNDGQTGTVVVDRDGSLLCADFGANACATTVTNTNAATINVPNTWHVTPGFVVGDPSIRLGDEVLSSSEQSGGDGVATGEFAERLNISLAAGGVHGSTRLSRGVFADGILSYARAPQTGDILGGSCAVLRTGDGFYDSELALEPNGAVLAEAAGLYFVLGNDARSGTVAQSVSGQIAAITKLLGSLNGTLAAQAAQRGVFVRAHHADDILAVLRLAKKFANYQWRIVGGAEAHLVAAQIESAGVPLIVSAPRCRRDTLESMRCRQDRLRLLVNAGVSLALSTPDTDQLRGLRLDAGHEWARNRIGERAALRAISQVPGSLYGLNSEGVGTLVLNKPARLVLFTGHPLVTNSVVAAVIDGRRRRCAPTEAPFVGYEEYSGWR